LFFVVKMSSEKTHVILSGEVVRTIGRKSGVFRKKKAYKLVLTPEALYFQHRDVLAPTEEDIEQAAESGGKKKFARHKRHNKKDDPRLKLLLEKGSEDEAMQLLLNETVIDLRVIQSVAEEGKVFVVNTASAIYTCEVSDAAEAAKWSKAIKDAVAAVPSPPPSKLTSLFVSVDSSKNGKVEQEEIMKLIKRLGVRASADDVRRIFADVDKDHNGALDFSEFVQLYEMLLAIPEVQSLFGQLVIECNKGESSLDNLYLDEHGLKQFLRSMENKKEGDDDEVSSHFARAVMHSFHSYSMSTPLGCMDVAAFTEFLTSPVANGIVDPSVLARPQDMTRPIAEYFIASSHNTYLEGHQLRGVSSAAAYDAAFAKTCRCVEIDLWDGPNGEPTVYHGHTLVSKATAREVIEVIAKKAFTLENNTPVILSLENHCCIAQQEAFAKILKDVLGDMLAGPFPSNHQPLLSPENLAGKILLKGKITSEAAKVEDGSAPAEKTILSDITHSASDGVETKDKKKEAKKKIAEAKQISEELTKLTHLGTFRCAAKESNAVIHSELSEEGDPKALSSGKPSRMMFSLSEGKVIKLMGSSGCSSDPGFTNTRAVGTSAKVDAVHMLQKYNAIHVTRTYPKGTRVGSSNYNPLPGWHTGCQLVALNYQTPGLAMWLNKALFSLNGGCGYVLKPQWMIAGQQPPESEAVKVTIRIISAGRLLPENSTRMINPTVVVNFFGYLGNTEQFVTSSVKANAWNPVWGEESSHVIVAPDVTLVQFAIVHGSEKSTSDGTLTDDLVCQCTVPFSAVRPGYRSVPLYNPQTGDKLEDAFLLVHLKIEPYTKPAPAPEKPAETAAAAAAAPAAEKEAAPAPAPEKAPAPAPEKASEPEKAKEETKA